MTAKPHICQTTQQPKHKPTVSFIKGQINEHQLIFNRIYITLSANINQAKEPLPKLLQEKE